MSTVIVVTPLVVANWSLIASAATSALAASRLLNSTTTETSLQKADTVSARNLPLLARTTTFDLPNSQITDGELLVGEEMVFQHGPFRVVLTLGADKQLQVCVSGECRSTEELRAIGEELANGIAQQNVYHRLMTELRARQVEVIEQHVASDQTIRLRIRDWK